MPNGFNKRFPKKKAFLVETDLTPEELGRNLKHQYDVVLLGETHISQKLIDTNASIFKELNASILFEEGHSGQRPKNYEPGCPEPRQVSNWGTINTPGAIAESSNIPTIGVEPLAFRKNLSKVSNTIARLTDGELEVLARSMSSAYVAALDAGIKSSEIKFLLVPISKQTPEEREQNLSKFFDVAGSRIPEYHHHHTLKASENFELSKKDDLLSKIRLTADLNIDIKMIPYNTKKDERSIGMAEIMESEIRKLSKDGKFHGSALTVGSNHNDLIEDKLEQQQLRVANIKSKTTSDPSKHNKVFRNPNPNAREGAEWVVAIYDEHFPVEDFGEDFTTTKCGSSRSPVDLPPESSAGSKAK